MLYSQLFTKTVKEIPTDETSFNAQALIRAGFVNKVGAGIYTFLPLGLRVLNKINNIIREEMNQVGGQEVLMPALTPKDGWVKTGRWENFDALFKLQGNDQKEYALGATHEEIVTPLAQAYLLSYKDLPFSIYQVQVKFRNEKRAKAGLLRGREFIMKDMYSFHTDQTDLDSYYEKVKAAYFKIYARLGLGDITYLTYASGGTFAKYSHEFQTLTASGEDEIYVCEKCKVAINKEIIVEQNVCPVCGNNQLAVKTGIEVGNIFKLGTKYSDSFNLRYTDEKGNNQPVIMGCYGMGPSRILGTVVEASHDEKGIIWPEAIAPFKVHLISLKENEVAKKIYDELVASGLEVFFDDRDQVSAGEKFADADLIGIPYRLVVSSKTVAQDSAELKRRLESETKLIKLTDLVKTLS